MLNTNPPYIVRIILTANQPYICIRALRVQRYFKCQSTVCTYPNSSIDFMYHIYVDRIQTKRSIKFDQFHVPYRITVLLRRNIFLIKFWRVDKFEKFWRVDVIIFLVILRYPIIQRLGKQTIICNRECVVF